MTDSEKQLVIAEFCGWTRTKDGLSWVSPTGSINARWRESGNDSLAISNSEILPDYLHDLNAMHEAELKLQNQFTLDLKTYWRHLEHVEPHPIFATAAQRAEALLRTIGKIEETDGSDRVGDWFLTFSGRKVWPRDVWPQDIIIYDIAHALANICRFGGHSICFYSVAQHSVIVSQLVPPEHALAGLLHDATEAYVGDMVRPLKYALPSYRAIEDRVWLAIAARFGLPAELPPVVKHADNAALAAERRDLMTQHGEEWNYGDLGGLPLPPQIVPLLPDAAEKLFLDRLIEIKSPAK